MDITLTLTQEQTQLVVDALKKLPMEVVEQTVLTIVGQANNQLQAEQMKAQARTQTPPDLAPELPPITEEVPPI